MICKKLLTRVKYRFTYVYMSSQKFPKYFVLNPLTANKKLSKFLFNDNGDGVKYYPSWVSGSRPVSHDSINDFIKKFFHHWIR